MKKIMFFLLFLAWSNIYSQKLFIRFSPAAQLSDPILKFDYSPKWSAAMSSVLGDTFSLNLRYEEEISKFLNSLGEKIFFYADSTVGWDGEYIRKTVPVIICSLKWDGKNIKFSKNFLSRLIKYPVVEIKKEEKTDG